MYNRDKLYNELLFDEGIRYHVYTDTLGYKTIGIGHLIKKNESFVTVNEKQVRDMFWADVAEAENVLNKIFPSWVDLDDTRQRTMINLAFNLGMKLGKFKKFLAYMEKREYDYAASALEMSLWYSQVKSRGPRIVKAIRTGVR